MGRENKNGPVVVIGFSAGAHLLACASAGVGQEDFDIDAQVLCYPSIEPNEWQVESLAEFARAKVNSPEVKSLMLGRERIKPGKAFVSPPPTFIVASTQDNVCPHKMHADTYAAAVETAGVHCKYMLGPYGDHGF